MNLAKLFSDRDFKRVVSIFLIYKIFVITTAYAATALVPANITHTENVTDNMLNPFAQYDATAYLYIATNGYTADFGAYHIPNYHWYPLYPLLIRIFGFAGYDVAAFLISNIASFLSIALLYLLTRDTLDKIKAEKTVIYILFFPTAYYFTVMYTEPLFLGLTLGAFYAARKKRWAASGVIGFFAALSRAQGVIVFLPVVYMYAKSRGLDFRRPDIRKIKTDVLYTFLIPLGTFVFALYEYAALGDFFAQFKSLEIQGVARGGMPWDGYIHALTMMAGDTTFINISYHIFNIFLMTSFIFLCYICWKKLPAEYTIYFAASLALLLFAKNFLGAPRYLLVIFPAFMTLPLLENGKTRYIIYALYAVFIVMAIGMIALHVTERFNSPLLYTPLF